MSTIEAETRLGMMLNPVVRAMAFCIGSAILAITIFAPGFYKDLGEFAFFVGPADGESWRWAARGLVAGAVLGIGQHLAGMGRPGQDEIGGTLPTGDSRRWAGMEMSARWVLGIGRYFGGAGRQGWGWIWGTLVGAGIGGAFSGPLCFYLYWQLPRLLPVVGWDHTTIPPTTGIGQWAWIPGMAVWGVCIGAGQSLAWRSQFTRPIRWAGATSLIWTLATAGAVTVYQVRAALFPRSSLEDGSWGHYLWVVVPIGVLVGLLQQVVLRWMLPDDPSEN